MVVDGGLSSLPISISSPLNHQNVSLALAPLFRPTHMMYADFAFVSLWFPQNTSNWSPLSPTAMSLSPAPVGTTSELWFSPSLDLPPERRVLISLVDGIEFDETKEEKGRRWESRSSELKDLIQADWMEENRKGRDLRRKERLSELPHELIRQFECQIRWYDTWYTDRWITEVESKGFNFKLFSNWVIKGWPPLPLLAAVRGFGCHNCTALTSKFGLIEVRINLDLGSTVHVPGKFMRAPMWDGKFWKSIESKMYRRVELVILRFKRAGMSRRKCSEEIVISSSLSSPACHGQLPSRRQLF